MIDVAREEKDHSSHVYMTETGPKLLLHLGDLISERDRARDDSIRRSRMTSYGGATAAMIAYDDVDNDRGSAAAAGGGGGRSPSRQAGIDVASFRCRASSFQFAVSSTSFAFSDSRFRTFTTGNV